MIETVTTICFALLGFAMLAAIVRIIRGPTLADRILGLDTITVIAVGIIGLFAVTSGLSLYADIAIAVALVGFLSTVAFARYLLSRARN
ncbi:MAG: cation:proton antiporter [Devosia sp.]|jgi:multicomponent Na+:H+ antiporter subunit F|nr:monovalent cation/H+ antiporter complex subunit F [Devosia sp.]MBL8596293.1 cation:proton antiporter [Devosia sp.]